MKIVIAIDSFKGSMTSIEAGSAAAKGILKAHPDAEIVVKPLADGGEGTTDALIEGLGGERVNVTVSGPLGGKIEAYYGLIADKNIAVLEMASAAGLTLSKGRNPLCASTYGVGEMISDALCRGIRNFIIGIGGSATNDGGTGMLKALGWRFLRSDGSEAGMGAGSLSEIDTIRMPDEKCMSLLSECSFQVACDVKNPLCGPLGATYIYGPQKGIVSEDVKERTDKAMAHFADVSAALTGRDLRDVPGTGAAGGLGFAFLSYLNAKLTPGVDLILDAVGLEDELKDADIVVTGEGRIDAQTAMGKAPAGVAALAKKHRVKVVAFAGSLTEDAGKCNDAGMDAIFPIVRGVTTLSEAMDPQNARKNMTLASEQVFRLL